MFLLGYKYDNEVCLKLSADFPVFVTLYSFGVIETIFKQMYLITT